MSCLSLYHDMTVQCVCNHGIRFPGRISDYLNSDSVRVSSQVLIICHDNTIIPKMFVQTLTTSSSMFQAAKLKSCTQQLKHEKYRNQANQKTTSTFLHDVSLRSASNSEF